MAKTSREGPAARPPSHSIVIEATVRHALWIVLSVGLLAGSEAAGAEVPAFSSLPGAPVKIFLDFRGTTSSTPWGTYVVPATPAYSVDADTASFSITELENIDQIWRRVAEKFSPFNVNVTTVDPGTYPYNEVVRVVIGGNGSWYGAVAGGLSYPNGFFGSNSNTVWVFSDNLAAANHGFPKFVAECVAHESGHTFGLQHQSKYNPDGSLNEEYSTGDGAKAPIMGKSYYVRGIWWNGTSSSQYTTQNDLAILNTALAYRADDHANSSPGADPLTGGATLTGSGIIERITDIDVFRFTSPGGAVTLTGDVATYGAMLDLTLKLRDSGGTLLDWADTAALGESLTFADLPAGDYFLEVASHGAYGDIGQYTVTATLTPEPGSAAVILMAMAALLQRRHKRAAAWS